MRSSLSIVLTALLLVACASSAPRAGAADPAPAPTAAAKPPAGETCSKPRTRHCPDTKAPVCAIRDTGIRCVTTPCDSTEQRTYDNGCMACLDPNVQTFTPGACADKK